MTIPNCAREVSSLGPFGPSDTCLSGAGRANPFGQDRVVPHSETFLEGVMPELSLLMRVAGCYTVISPFLSKRLTPYAAALMLVATKGNEILETGLMALGITRLIVPHLIDKAIDSATFDLPV